MSETVNKAKCCQGFDPAVWDGKEIVWQDKTFIKDRVASVFHIPLNFGAVITRMMKRIEADGVSATEPRCLSDENSLWGADLYVATPKEIPGAANVKLSGKFLTKVFEGDYKNMGAWIEQMRQMVVGRGKEIKKLYFHYATCPKCAKETGKRYTVIFAEI